MVTYSLLFHAVYSCREQGNDKQQGTAHPVAQPDPSGKAHGGLARCCHRLYEPHLVQVTRFGMLIDYTRGRCETQKGPLPHLSVQDQCARNRTCTSALPVHTTTTTQAMQGRTRLPAARTELRLFG